MIAPYREAGIVLDIGTGDGRFVFAAAKANPNRFYIGIDANAKPLEKRSIKITRKRAKGGMPNAMFVQAAVEDLPEELDGIASEIYVNFPWGSLLRAVATGDERLLASLRRILVPRGALTVTMGVHRERDRGEFQRLGLGEINAGHIERILVPSYSEAGFRLVGTSELSESDDRERPDSTWARKLSTNKARKTLRLSFLAD